MIVEMSTVLVNFPA